MQQARSKSLDLTSHNRVLYRVSKKKKPSQAVNQTQTTALSPQAAKAQLVAQQALLMSRVMPHSNLTRAEISPDLDTWAVTGSPDSTGKVHFYTLLIGEKTLNYFGTNEIAAVALHETGHNCFTFFAADGNYIRNSLFSDLENIFEDGRINAFIRKRLPETGQHFPGVYRALDRMNADAARKEGKPHPSRMAPHISTNPNPLEKEQEECLNRLRQLLILENSEPGSGESLIRSPEWVRNPRERQFITTGMEYYKLYKGVSPSEMFGKSKNMANNAKALKYLFAFDKFCGRFFNLAPKKLPTKEEAMQILVEAKEVLPEIEAKWDPEHFKVFNDNFQKAALRIESGDITHTSVNTIMSAKTIAALIEQKTISTSGTAEVQEVVSAKSKVEDRISEYRLSLAKNKPPQDELDAFSEILKAVKNWEQEAIKDILKDPINSKLLSAHNRLLHSAEQNPKAARSNLEPILQALEKYAHVAERAGHSRDVKIQDGTTNSDPNQQSNPTQGKTNQSKDGQGQSSQDQNKQGQSGQGQSGNCNQPSQSGQPNENQNGQGSKQGQSRAGSGGQGGIGHTDAENGSKPQDQSTPTPEYQKRRITEADLPWIVLSGSLKENFEKELLIRKSKAPGQSSETNGQLSLSNSRILAYEEMLRREFLSAKETVEGVYFKKERSIRYGHVDPERYMRYDLSDHREDDFFDIYTPEIRTSEAKGEELSPDLVVFLMDCSGSMHHVDAELGAFGVALRLLAHEKNTRTIMLVGSDKDTAWVDTKEAASVALGREGLIESYERAFSRSNGGNSPTWDPDNMQELRNELQNYPPHKVKIIIGSDLAIQGSELEYIRDLKEAFSVFVVNEVPEACIELMGKHIRCNTKSTEVVHNAEDAELIDVSI